MTCKEFCKRYKGYYVKIWWRDEDQLLVTGVWRFEFALEEYRIELQESRGYRVFYCFSDITQSSLQDVYTQEINDKIKDICKLINTYRSAKRGGVG